MEAIRLVATLASITSSCDAACSTRSALMPWYKGDPYGHYRPSWATKCAMSMFLLSCFWKQNKKEINWIRATDLEFCSFFPNVKNGPSPESDQIDFAKLRDGPALVSKPTKKKMFWCINKLFMIIVSNENNYLNRSSSRPTTFLSLISVISAASIPSCFRVEWNELWKLIALAIRMMKEITQR